MLNARMLLNTQTPFLNIITRIDIALACGWSALYHGLTHQSLTLTIIDPTHQSHTLVRHDLRGPILHQSSHQLIINPFYGLPLGKSLLARDQLTSSSHHFAPLFVLLPFLLCYTLLCSVKNNFTGYAVLCYAMDGHDNFVGHNSQIVKLCVSKSGT